MERQGSSDVYCGGCLEISIASAAPLLEACRFIQETVFRPMAGLYVVIGMEANMVLKQTKVLGEKMQVLESLCFLELQGNTMQVPPSPGKHMSQPFMQLRYYPFSVPARERPISDYYIHCLFPSLSEVDIVICQFQVGLSIRAVCKCK